MHDTPLARELKVQRRKNNMNYYVKTFPSVMVKVNVIEILTVNISYMATDIEIISSGKLERRNRKPSIIIFTFNIGPF